ncbi:choline transporter-like 2 [Chironomus tepperi]|uniref:choline transporter-like 2 n=1 Tax=Chironomus tepperi TaxID=113505 RepID=UPI00391F7F05
MEIEITNKKFLSNKPRESFRCNSNFRGPLVKRNCTDVICLIFFFIFLIIFGFTVYYAQREGNLKKILIPRDSEGFQCGKDSEVVDSNFLFFFDLAKCADPFVPINGCPTPQTCVQECPKETFHHDKTECMKDLEEYKKKLICNRHIIVKSLSTCMEVDERVKKQECAQWYLKSEPFGNRCLPTFEDIGTIINKSEEMQKFFETLYNVELFGSLNGIGQLILEDTINTWPVFVMGLMLAAICSLIIISIMRWVAGPVVWLSIIGVLTLLGAGLFYSFYQYDFYTKNPHERFNLQPNLKSIINSYFIKAETWLYILIGSSLVFFGILLLVVVFRKRISIAIALIKEGSKAVSSNLTTIIFPIFPWIIQTVIIFLAILTFFNLSSIGDPVYRVLGKNEACVSGDNYSTNIQNGDLCDPKLLQTFCNSQLGDLKCTMSCIYIGIKSPPIAIFFKIMNIVGFFWLLFFVSALSEMVLAGTFARWYWTIKKSDVPYFNLTRSLYRTIRYHLGTLAFGSLILTICRIIRLVLEYVNEKLKKYNNELTKTIMCCCRCLCFCLETFLKFLNRNAYIMCAIHGKSFIPSAKDAFNLLMRNVLRVVALDQTTDFLFFLSKLMISLSTSSCCYIYFTSEWFSQHFPNVFLHYLFVQIFFVFTGSYIIATIFFNVYSMAVDTLFLCFLEDCERNDGSLDRPYFMSKKLMKILDKSNK